MSWTRRARSSRSASGEWYFRIVSSKLYIREDTIVQKIYRIGVQRWRTSASRIRYNPESIQGVVVWMALHTNVLWAVNANWNGDKLNVEAYSLDNPNDWNQGNRFLSRDSIVSRLYLGTGFLLKYLSSIRQSYARFLQYLYQVR